MPESAPRQDRLFFGLAGVWFLLLTLVGFGPSFYIRVIPEPLPTNQIVHGVVYTAWILLFLTQALLISTRRIRLHRLLGKTSVVLLLIMIPVGFHVVLDKTAAGLKTVDGAGFNLVSLSLAFAMAFTGIAYRERPFVHKRLMLFATLMLTIAAADRVAFLVGLEELRIFRKALAVVPGVALVAYDAWTSRRFPKLSTTLLAVTWLNIWFVVSDLIFMRPVGEAIISGLTRVFVW